MSPLELKRRQAEVKKLESAIFDQELKIMERMQDIETIKKVMGDQQARIDFINEEISKGN